MTEMAIAAEGQGKRFGRVTALDGVDLELPAGSVLGLPGPNAALCLGGPTTRPVIEATLWLTALLAITIPAAIGRYRHVSSS